jgi:hypothetical protein
MIFVHSTQFPVGEEVFVEEHYPQPDIALQEGITKVVQHNGAPAIPIIVANISEQDVKLPRNWAVSKITRHKDLEATKLETNHPPGPPVPDIGISPFSNDEIRELFPLKEVPAKYRPEFLQILIDHKDVFGRNQLDLGDCKVLPHKLELKDPGQVVNMPPHRIPPNLQPVVNKYVDNLLAAKVIRPSTSPFNSPLMLVKKPNADPSKPIEQRYRVCHNYTRVNTNLKVCSYPLTNLYSLLDSVGAAKCWSTLDLAQGFFQQRLVDPHGASAFSVPGKGLYEYLRSPMGISSSPGMFQRLLDYCMRDLPHTYVYLDDIVAATQTYEEHLQVIRQILGRLRKYKLKISPHKAHFGTSEVNYLGHNISRQHGIRPGALKTECIRKALPPQSLQLIKAFLGLAGFFRRAVPRFSEIAAHLINCCGKILHIKEVNCPRKP